MFMILGILCYLASLVCSIIILIHAFQNAIWKGIVSLLCGLFFIYYALVEFQHDKKWAIVAGSLLSGLVGAIFMGMSGVGR